MQMPDAPTIPEAAPRPARGARPTPGESNAPAPAGHARLTTALLVAMAVIWGVNYSVVKFGAEGIAPLAFNGLRVGLAAVVLLALAALGDAPRPTRADTLALLGLGVLGNGLYQLFFILGIARTSAGTTALLLAASPAFVAIVGRLLRVERVRARGWAAIALQLVGMAFVVFGATRAGAAHGGGSGLTGAAILLCACLCWASYTVLLRQYTLRVDPIRLSALTMVGGAVPLLLVAAPALASVAWSAVSVGVWGAVAYSGLLALVLAYLFWYRGIRTLGPTRTAMFGNLQPIIALVVAWAWLHEVPTIWQGIGAVGIVVGLLLSSL